jgi:hypothetical protein
MWILILVLLLLSAHLNLTALVPLQPGGTPPPWWVGGRLAWPFAVETRTLLPQGDLLNTATPILGIGAAICFLLATAALLGWFIPPQWFSLLVASGALLSISLQVVWFSPWALLPLLLDVLLLWGVFGMGLTVKALRG